MQPEGLPCNRLPRLTSFGSRASEPSAAAARAVNQLARYCRFGHSLARNVGIACILAAIILRHGSPSLYFHLDAQLIAGLTGRRNLARSMPVNTITLSLRSSTSVSSRAPPGLRDGFHDQHARHDWQSGKCPLKNGSLIVTFLMATIALCACSSSTRSISSRG